MPVAKKDFDSAKIKALIKKMRTALGKEEFGVALAAPQMGSPLRLFVVSEKVFGDETKQKIEKPVLVGHTVFINPEIIRLSRKKREMSEGCLSVRGKYGTVMRHEKASLKAQDEHGKEFVYHSSGLLAHIFQHECDHLNGVVYTDLAVKLQDDESRNKLRAEFPA